MLVLLPQRDTMIALRHFSMTLVLFGTRVIYNTQICIFLTIIRMYLHDNDDERYVSMYSTQCRYKTLNRLFSVQ